MYVRYFFLLLLISTSINSKAQEWTLIDSGAGLLIDFGEQKAPKIIGRSTRWDFKDLKEKGAFEGKFNGNQLFAAWIQGPETKEFINTKGKTVWLYKYIIVYPDGKKKVSETLEFNNSGFSYFALNPENYTEGIWKIEWYLVSRDKAYENQVATTIFEAISDKTGNKGQYKIKIQ